MTVIRPVAFTSAINCLTAGTDPYLDTDDGDTSYLQLAPSTWTVGSRSTIAHLRMPTAGLCPNPRSVSIAVKGRWVNQSGGTTVPPVIPDTIYVLTYLGRAASASGAVRLTEYAEGSDHRSTTFATTTAPLLERDGFYTWSQIAGYAASGSLYLSFILNGVSDDDHHDFRITYAAATWTCAQPRIRQRQRDDFRQRQRESRQLAPRGRSYI